MEGDPLALISTRSADGAESPGEAGRYYHKIMKRDPGALRAGSGTVHYAGVRAVFLHRLETRMPDWTDGWIAVRDDRAKAPKAFCRA